MSVLKTKRHTGPVQFITTAHDIEVETLNFISRLSYRYAKVLSTPVSDISATLLRYVIKANSIFPSSQASKEERRILFSKALGELSSLDNMLTICYDIMMKNPQGCFEKPNGNLVSANEAIERLDKMCDRLGTLLDQEEGLIVGIMKGDQKR